MRAKIHRFFIFTALEGLIFLIFLLGIPADPENAWLFGFSPERLALAGSMLVGAALLGWGALVTAGKLPAGAKLPSLFRSIQQRDRIFALLLTLFSSGLVAGAYYFYLWTFSTYGDRFGAVFLRLAPLVLFGMAVCAHLLFLFYSTASREKRLPWVGAILFPFAGLLLQIPFLPEDLLVAVLALLPLLSLGFGLIAYQFQTGERRLIAGDALRWLAIGLIFSFLAYFYVQTASEHARRANTILSRDDQGAYLNFAVEVYESGYRYTGDRNRMPVYPTIQAIFYDPELTEEGFFLQGKQLNIYLSLVCLGGLALIFRRFLPFHDAINLTLVAAFSVFIFRSAYFQAELLFYTLNLLCFVLLARMLISPSLKLALLAGTMLGLAHLTKASVLPGLLLFGGIALVKPLLANLGWASQSVRNAAFKKQLLINGTGVMLVGFSFLAVVFPYILESKQIFGRYFYNVNSTFYMWYDSWEEARAGTRAHGDRAGWPDLPPDEIPGPVKYLREHTPRQILGRLRDGLIFQFSIIRDQYNAFNYPVLLSAILLFFIALDFRRSIQIIRAKLPLVIFGVLYFTGYILLYAWYTPISDGPRFTYALSMSFLFSTLVSVQYLARHRDPGHNGDPGWGAPLLARLAGATISIFLVMDIYFVLTRLLAQGYYGS